MKDHDDVDQWFQRFDSLIGLKYLKLIHFNDSNVKFNGHNDNHDDIGQGYITNPTKGGNPNGLFTTSLIASLAYQRTGTPKAN